MQRTQDNPSLGSQTVLPPANYIAKRAAISGYAIFRCARIRNCPKWEGAAKMAFIETTCGTTCVFPQYLKFQHSLGSFKRG